LHIIGKNILCKDVMIAIFHNQISKYDVAYTLRLLAFQMLIKRFAIVTLIASVFIKFNVKNVTVLYIILIIKMIQIK